MDGRIPSNKLGCGRDYAGKNGRWSRKRMRKTTCETYDSVKTLKELN